MPSNEFWEATLGDLPRNDAAIARIKGEEKRLKAKRRRSALKGWRTRRAAPSVERDSK